METPPMVSLEEHQCKTHLGLRDLSGPFKSDATSGDPSQNHRGNHYIPEDHGAETDGNIHDFRNSFIDFEYTNVGCLKGLCCQEATIEPTLESAKLPEKEIESISPDLNEKCNFPEALHCKSEDFENLEPASEAFAPTVPAEPTQKIQDLPNNVTVCEKQANSNFSDSSTHSNTISHESSEVEEPSPDGVKEKNGQRKGMADEDDDDISQELFQSKTNLWHDQQKSKDKEKRKDCVVTDDTISCCGYEAEGETSSKEESPQVKSPWSESMNQLMRKLDQLYQDIEEALSASSSPADTPCMTRKKPEGAVLESTVNLNEKALQRPDGGECQSLDRSSAFCSLSMGTRERTKKTMFNKMTTASDSGKRLFFFVYLTCCK